MRLNVLKMGSHSVVACLMRSYGTIALRAALGSLRIYAERLVNREIVPFAVFLHFAGVNLHRSMMPSMLRSLKG